MLGGVPTSMKRIFFLFLIIIPMACGHSMERPGVILQGWRETIWLPYEINILAVQSRELPDRVVYLWFYEHTLFDAFERGHSIFHGPLPTHMRVHDDGLSARLHSLVGQAAKLYCKPVHDGVDLWLRVTNQTDYDWPEIGGLIPCLFPGSPDPRFPDPPIDELFRDEEHARTWFVGEDGLELLDNRDIHFNHRLRELTDDAASGDGTYTFTVKWPTSSRNAHAGLMIRESADGEWVTGIGWKDFVSVQGHNPLRCLHPGAKIGPLAPGETKTIIGKIYLFKGNGKDCLERYRDDFSTADIAEKMEFDPWARDSFDPFIEESGSGSTPQP